MAKILVVDDNDDIRHLTQSFLTSEGHRVLLASGGDVALESMKTDPPDLVILDIMMPGMDGYQVMQRMTAEGLKERIKVVVLTAKNSEADWMKGYRLGADDYLTKPFELDELTACFGEGPQLHARAAPCPPGRGDRKGPPPLSAGVDPGRLLVVSGKPGNLGCREAS